MFGINIEQDVPVDTIISAGTRFQGVLESEESLRIDGGFEGTINCKGTLIIGPNAEVEAEIITEEAVIGGRVDGNVTAHKKIEIRSTGKIFGDLAAPVLQIADGVKLEGSCTINAGSEDAEKAAEEAAEEAEAKVTSIKEKLG